METIKGYLEAMFASMPNTTEVRKAKSELLQMMEDKYNEMIAEGISENTAVGTVISEFGNLDELADDLGLTKEVEEVRGKESDMPRRHISYSEVQNYIADRAKKALFLSLGIMLCIVSVAFPILFEVYGDEDQGAALMFACIALGVGSIVYSNFVDSNWRFIKNELCQIDMSTASYVKEKRRGFEAVRAICVTLGIILCIVCWTPVAFLENVFDDAGTAIMFLFVGIGVFLIVYSNKISKGFDNLLALNDASTISGNYNENTDGEVKYINKLAETVMAVYWPTVTCLYLIVSFLTFEWGITWIIWPVAAVAHRAVEINCIEDGE